MNWSLVLSCVVGLAIVSCGFILLKGRKKISNYEESVKAFLGEEYAQCFDSNISEVCQYAGIYASDCAREMISACEVHN